MKKGSIPETEPRSRASVRFLHDSCRPPHPPSPGAPSSRGRNPSLPGSSTGVPFKWLDHTPSRPRDRAPPAGSESPPRRGLDRLHGAVPFREPGAVNAVNYMKLSTACQEKSIPRIPCAPRPRSGKPRRSTRAGRPGPSLFESVSKTGQGFRLHLTRPRPFVYLVSHRASLHEAHGFPATFSSCSRPRRSRHRHPATFHNQRPRKRMRAPRRIPCTRSEPPPPVCLGGGLGPTTLPPPIFKDSVANPSRAIPDPPRKAKIPPSYTTARRITARGSSCPPRPTSPVPEGGKIVLRYGAFIRREGTSFFLTKKEPAPILAHEHC